MKPKPLRKRDNRYWCAKYYRENRNKILKYHKERYLKDREEILKRQKIYDDAHRKEKRIRDRKHYHKNK